MHYTFQSSMGYVGVPKKMWKYYKENQFIAD